jgi:hypothetical protein
MNPSLAQLLSNVSTQVTGAAVNYQGGIAAFLVEGTMGGCTVTLQIMGPDGNWDAFSTATTVTSAGTVAPVYAPPGSYRAVVSAANPTGLYAALYAVDN